MKREPLARPALARHEAGHLVAMALLDEPGMFSWRRLAGYEIAHVTERQRRVRRWNDPAARDAMIAKRAVIALAGGAAERSAMPADAGPANELAAVHAWTGAVDFELAHEWLTLQRYDGNQAAIMDDIVRLFGELSALFARAAQRRAIFRAAVRIEALLATADRHGRSDLSVPAAELLQGITLDPAPVFVLRATVRAERRPRAS